MLLSSSPTVHASPQKYRCCCCRCRPAAILSCTLVSLTLVLAAVLFSYSVVYVAKHNLARGAAQMPDIPLQPPPHHQPCTLPLASSAPQLQWTRVTNKNVTLCSTVPAAWVHAQEVTLIRTGLGAAAKSPSIVIASVIPTQQTMTWRDSQIHDENTQYPLMAGCRYRYMLVPGNGTFSIPHLSRLPHSNNVTVKLQNAGTCGNERDVAALRQHNVGSSVSSAILSCVLHLFSSSCLQAHLQRNLAVSTPCAACFTTIAQCALNDCAAPCMAHDPSCQDCVKQRCQVPCLGIPEE